MRWEDSPRLAAHKGEKYQQSKCLTYARTQDYWCRYFLSIQWLGRLCYPIKILSQTHRWWSLIYITYSVIPKRDMILCLKKYCLKQCCDGLLLNSPPLEGSDRVNHFAPSQTVRPYAVWTALRTILPILWIYRSASFFSRSLKNQLDWDKRRGLNDAHADTWIIERLHSKQSLWAQNLQGWAGKYMRYTQNHWPRKQSSLRDSQWQQFEKEPLKNSIWGQQDLAAVSPGSQVSGEKGLASCVRPSPSCIG